MDRTKVQGKITGLELPQFKRLASFCKAKRANRDKAIFDDRMMSELQLIVKDKKWLNEIKQYLDSMGFCQSKYDAELLQSQIIAFSGENHKYNGWIKHYKEALAETIAEFRHAELSPITYDSKEKFMKTLPRTDTHAGFIYFETGLRTKGENVESIYQDWDSILKEAISDGSFNLPIIPGMRTQASGAFKGVGEKTNTWKSKTRLVNMVDLRVIMAESMYSRPVQRHMSLVTNWYAGGKTPEWLSSRINTCKRDYGHSVTIDYSNYDQSISNWLIYDAFKVIKAMFLNFEGREEPVYDVVVNDFINKSFIDIYGNLIFAHKGVPSGSMFTQIIDSIVNIIMIRTYLKARGITKYDCLIMGDDNIVFTNQQLDLEDLAGYLSHVFGITMNPMKCSSATWKDEGVEFLSRVWKQNGEWRDPAVLVSKLLYPETYRLYDKCGFKPKHVIKSYFDTFILGMREMTKDLTEREYFYEVDTNVDSSVKKTFLTGVERYRAAEKERMLNDKFIMQI